MTAGGDATLSQELLDELWRHSSVRPDRLVGARRLAALFETWCRSIPYDTATKIVRYRDDEPLWGLDTDEVVHTALTTGLGASCFPLAAGFAAAARADGFEAHVHLANSVGNAAAEHALCVIPIDGTQWLCDPAFVHLEPAAIPTVSGSQHRVGPLWSPLWVARVGNLVRFTVERGASTQRRSYILGDAASPVEFAAVYEVAGRWDTGLEFYMRRAVSETQVVCNAKSVTIKSREGLTRRAVTSGELAEWLTTVGVTPAGVEVVHNAVARAQLAQEKHDL